MARASSSFCIQTDSAGYVAATPRLGGGVDVYSRTEESSGWSGPQTPFGSEFDSDGVALIELSDQSLEMILLQGGQLLHYSQAQGQRWHGFEVLPGNMQVVAGPAFIHT